MSRSAEWERTVEWEQSYRRDQGKRYDEVLRLIDDLPVQGRVLDVGAVPGHMTAALQGRGYETVGLDLSPERVRPEYAKNLDVRRCDVERDTFPVESDSFDLVVFSEVLEHLRAGPTHALREIARALKPGGVHVLTTPNRFGLVELYYYLLRHDSTFAPDEFEKLETLGHMGHVRLYSPTEVESFLASVGLETVETRFSNFGAKAGLTNPLLGPLARAAYRIDPSLKKYQIHVSRLPR